MHDFINSLFEFGLAAMLCLNIRQLLRDKEVKGFHWAPLAFVTVWGLWNIFYYPSLGQWWSAGAGVLVLLCNITILMLTLRYLVNPGTTETCIWTDQGGECGAYGPDLRDGEEWAYCPACGKKVVDFHAFCGEEP